MYRIPEDLDFGFLVGLELIQVSIDQYNLLCAFHPEGSINIEGEWILEDLKGRVIDQQQEHGDRDCWRVHRIIGRTVSKAFRISDQELQLTFDDEFRLSIFDSSEQYESFNIQFRDLSLYV